MSKSTSASGGISFGGCLALIFITLKLVGVIHWSWWWVLSPLWIGVVLWLAIILVIFGAALVVEFMK
jgi:hypothetical protein